MKTLSKKVEVLFYCSIGLFIIPILLFYITDSKLKNHISTLNFQNDWTLKTDDFSKQVDIPYDYKDDKNLFSKKEVVFEKRFSKSNFNNYPHPSIVFGRMGDNTNIYFNDCIINLESKNNNTSWMWQALRFSFIPSQCIQEDNLLKIEISQWGFANKGIYDGPFGIGDYLFVKKTISLLEFYKYYVFFIYGVILLISVFVYYLFVYFLVPERKYNLIFSLFAFFTGIFEICVSTVPYRYLGNTTLVLYINFLSAVLASIFLIEFINLKLDNVKRKYFTYLYSSFGIIFLVSLFFSDINQIYLIYKIWFTYFFIAIFSNYIFLIIQKYRNLNYDQKRYVIGFSIFILTLLSDIYSAFTLNINLYLIPYGFIILLIISSLTLAKEAADAFIYVEEQVSERTKELSIAIEQAKGAEKMKEKFFAQISHDLKTPIAIALGAIEESTSKFSDSVGKILEPANRHLIRLNQMVLSILDNVKAESGELKLQWQRVRVVQYLTEILEPFKSVAKKNNVQLKYDFSGFQGLAVPMDPEKMERVIENIITNSLKYTKNTNKSEKIIELTLRVDQSKLYVDIEDSGLGIPESEREKVFEKFFQSSLTDLRIHGGSGIGLSFVKDMMDLHNGSVYASESKYRGSKFTLELPLSQNIENLQIYDFASTNPKVFSGSLNVEYPKSIPETIDPYKISVLYCEDNPEMAQIGYSTLKDLYNVFFAENGEEGLRMLEKYKIDLIISDIQMPRMDGYEMLTEIRKNPSFEKIPLIFLSSLGAEEDIVKGLNMGANDYLNKPMRKEMLHTRIKAQLKGSELMRKVVSSEKMSSLGLLFAGLAHEIKNPLNAASGQMIYLENNVLSKLKTLELKNTSEILQKIIVNLELITKSSNISLNAIKRIVFSVNEFSSVQQSKQKLSLKKVIENVCIMLEHKQKEAKFTEIKVISHDNDEVETYQSIEQVFLNLLSNSLDAIGKDKKGTIIIEIKNNNGGKTITVQDDGSGIEKKVIDHIFDAFATTKGAKEGSGLGLFISKQIVENQLGGTIDVQSQEGRGAIFTIKLPNISPDIDHIIKPFHGVEDNL
jgi:signal transduction histidine kinase